MQWFDRSLAHSDTHLEVGKRLPFHALPEVSAVCFSCPKNLT